MYIISSNAHCSNSFRSPVAFSLDSHGIGCPHVGSGRTATRPPPLIATTTWTSPPESPVSDSDIERANDIQRRDLEAEEAMGVSADSASAVEGERLRRLQDPDVFREILDPGVSRQAAESEEFNALTAWAEAYQDEEYTRNPGRASA